MPRESVSKAVRWKPIIDKCHEYIALHGRPTNILAMYRWVESQGVMSGLNEHGKKWVVSEMTFRVILSDRFGIGLKMRRKKKG